MTSELMNLTWVIALSAVMWVPYVVNTVMVQGLSDAVGYPATVDLLIYKAGTFVKGTSPRVETTKSTVS